MKKFLVPVFAVFLMLAAGWVQDVSAQVLGGGGSTNLENTVSGELGGRLGGGVFRRLRTNPGSAARRRTGGRSGSAAKSNKTTRNKTPAAKKPSTNTSVDDSDPFEILTYKPVGNLKTAEKLAGEFSTNAADKQAVLELFKAVKVSYDAEAAKKGKKNDVALALTFFMATCVTVYNDAPEPGDQAFDELYDALADALVEDEQFAKTGNAAKQEISENLIYISGLILAGYMNGKDEFDQDTVNAFRTLAGVSLLSLTGIDPGKMSFNNDGLYINP